VVDHEQHGENGNTEQDDATGHREDNPVCNSEIDPGHDRLPIPWFDHYHRDAVPPVSHVTQGRTRFQIDGSVRNRSHTGQCIWPYFEMVCQRYRDAMPHSL